MPSTILAGFADKNASLYRRMQVPLGDPAAWIEIEAKKIALVRDLEMDRVRQRSTADTVTCPAEHAPADGLDADRETATAQAAAVLLRGQQVARVRTDRSLPYIFAWHLQQAGIAIDYDAALGVVDRRQKTEAEIDALAAAQAVTEEVMRILCETIAHADVSADGTLMHQAQPLSSERLRATAAIEFLSRGYSMTHGAIVATAPEVADCHHAGSGILRTGIPVIVDLFPRNDTSRYNGDCTRTVVHGTPSDAVRAMHAAVVEAKAACCAKLYPGTTADEAHKASEETLVRHGYVSSRGTITDQPSIQHGTGHGIGLEVHEPILLDHGGGEMLAGEVFTIEPGLYGRSTGGVRIEDMVVVTADGPRNLNSLPEGLDWR